MTPVRVAILLAQTRNSVTLDCGGALTCRVALLKRDLARVLFLRNGAPQDKRTWMVTAHGEPDVPWHGRDRMDELSWPAHHVDLQITSGTITLAGAELQATITLAPFAITWSRPGAPAFAADRPSHAYAFARSGRLRHAMARHPADRYHGLGDKTGPLNLHGRRLRTTMLDSLGFDPRHGDPLYKHWPFLITRDGATGLAYGTFYDTFADSLFDLGAEHDNYHGPYRTHEAAAGDLDYYIFPGPRVADVTRKFLALTGPTALPPRWTLGFAQTAMAIADSADAQARMTGFIERCAQEDIPVSAFHFGSGYTSIARKRYVFTWNHEKYPDPPALLRQFHDAGMMTVANLKPCLLDDHPRYADALAAGAFICRAGTTAPVISQFWDGEGAHLDFTNPAAIAWWQKGLAEHVLDPGFDVAWNDNNEYSLWEDDGACDGFGTPIPIDRVRPLQPLLMTRASREEQARRSHGQRVFTITRAGCPGIQRYAQTWSGDNSTSWDSLRWNLRTGLQMSLSGLFNIGHDVGGFSGPVPDPELLVRWTQAGMLHPRFIMNSWKPDGVFTSPWLHPSATPLIRAAIRLRYRLLPYLYSLMHKAAHGHAPLLPTFAVFDQDPATHADCDDVMFGPNILAAPIIAPGQRMRDVYLPAGPECWFDVWTQEQLAAGTTVRVAAPLDRMPMLAPAGAIVPMTAAARHHHDEPTRLLRIYPGLHHGDGRFVMIEDDGVSQNGPCTAITFRLTWSDDGITLHAHVDGDYRPPITEIPVCLPEAERRKLTLTIDQPPGSTITLRRADPSQERTGPFAPD